MHPHNVSSKRAEWMKHRLKPWGTSRQRWIAAMVVMTLCMLLAGVLGTWHAAPAQASGDAMIFGVNMSLYDSHDQIVTNPATQRLIGSGGIPLVRVPFRAGLPDSTEVAAMQAVKNVGAAPLMIMHGINDGTYVTDDLHELSLVQSVFGNAPVYIEIGNEEDLSGVDQTQYTNGWNTVVPQLKQHAPASYKFVGPVNYQANPGYIGYFVGHATPRPDLVSWHEYVCSSQDSDATCNTHIANWATHVQQTNAAEQAAIGTTIPFFISEWNLDPLSDARYANPGFIQPWTTSALNEFASLIPHGLAGALLYTATNHGDFGLINTDNSLTPQGQTFFAAARGSGGSATATSTSRPIASVTPFPTPTGTPTRNPTSTSTVSASPTIPPTTPPPGIGHGYSFEDGGTAGWQAHGAFTVAVNSTDRAYRGTHSLEIKTTGFGNATYPDVQVANPPTSLGKAVTVTAHVWVPEGANLSAQLYVQDARYAWHTAGYVSLSPGSWTTLTYTVPKNTDMPLTALGVQFANHASTTFSGSVWLDAIGW